MELRPIKTETDYQLALQEIELLFDAAPNTPECDQLDILSTLVEAYEKTHFPIAMPRSDRGYLLLYGYSWLVRSRFGAISWQSSESV